MNAAPWTPRALRLGPALRPVLQEIKRNLRAKRYVPPGQAADAHGGSIDDA